MVGMLRDTLAGTPTVTVSHDSSLEIEVIVIFEVFTVVRYQTVILSIKVKF